MHASSSQRLFLDGLNLPVKRVLFVMFLIMSSPTDDNSEKARNGRTNGAIEMTGIKVNQEFMNINHDCSVV